MRVICTGISGTERVGFLDDVRALAAQAGRDLQIFDVREAMFQLARDVGEPVEEETILDMFPHALVLLRAAALEKISSLCEQAGDQQDWIINTHAVFRWKNTLISGFDPYYLDAPEAGPLRHHHGWRADRRASGCGGTRAGRTPPLESCWSGARRSSGPPRRWPASTTSHNICSDGRCRRARCTG